MDQVIEAIEAKEKRGELGPVVWRLCNYRMDSFNGQAAAGMSLATNNPRIKKLNEYVRFRLPKWVRVVEWGVASGVGILTGDLEMFGGNHPRNVAWMNLQTSLMFHNIHEVQTPPISIDSTSVLLDV